MSRIQPVDSQNTSEKSSQLLEGVKAKLGVVPNMFKVLAHSPAALESYLNFSGAVAKSSLAPSLREQIALTVGEANGCDYCLAAHSAIGKSVGLSEQQILDSREATAPDSKTEAVLQFSKEIVDKRGLIEDRSVERLRELGVSDAEITEIVAATALNIFTNYFNHVTDPVVDFPKAPELAKS
ncbi:MAG: carboxymuconolactone decarboxylase family protein [Planctomycetota bacterium]